jgi:hypothetical protein
MPHHIPSFTPGTITLIGSGEMSPSMGKVHRTVLSRITGAVHPVFLDTPAGFELNADEISTRAIQYFEQSLNLELVVASFKTTTAAAPDRVADVLHKLRRANYIFAGPGSPTYAVRHWRNSPVGGAMAQRLAEGAHVVLASAAAIAVGRYVLPVYEIYKVGQDPHWVDGLDLLGPYGLELAILPHWNNGEGGSHDTRYCFVGQPRMRYLEQRLSDSATILGIDEYTACIIDLGHEECQVMGAGQITVRQKGREEKLYRAGASFSMDELRVRGHTTIAERSPTIPLADWIEWPDTQECDDEALAPYIDTLVDIRARLRAEQHWALADEVRDRLAEMGIVLEDGPTATTWKRT